MASLVRAVEEAQSMAMACLNSVPILDLSQMRVCMKMGRKLTVVRMQEWMLGASVCVWDVDAVCEDLSEVAEWAGAAQLSPDTPLSRSPFAFSSRRLFDQPLI